MRIDLGNGAFQLGGDIVFVRGVAQGDVAAFVEARNRGNQPVPVRRILPEWRVTQDTTTGATAGTALAVRRGSGVKVKRASSVLATRAARKLQARNMVVAVLKETTDTHVYETHVLVIHSPLRSTGQQESAARVVARRAEVFRDRRRTILERVASTFTRRRRVRVVRWVVLGDFNASHSVMSQRIGGAHSYGRDVMGAVFSTGWDVECTARTLPGSDHAVLKIVETRR